jgi:crotonobetainyl-CoA:carnitine CoA-transferase CaiB-like acyl-CoA transferase
MGGLSYIHGLYDRYPLTHGNPQAQYRSGVVAASGTVAALLNLNGEGEHVDISMMEVVCSALRDTVPQYTFMGAVRRRSGRREGGPGAITPALDGYVIPSAYGGGDWSNFARFLDAPELDDERFATGDGRQLHAAELREIMGRVIARWKMIDFLEGAQAWGLGVGAVMTPKQVMEASHWNERDFFETIETSAGPVTAPRGAIRL